MACAVPASVGVVDQPVTSALTFVAKEFGSSWLRVCAVAPAAKPCR